MSVFNNRDVLGPPPDRITGTVVTAWEDIALAAPPGLLIQADRLAVELAAEVLAEVREGTPDTETPGFMHKVLGQFYMTP